jgi:translin
VLYPLSYEGVLFNARKLFDDYADQHVLVYHSIDHILMSTLRHLATGISVHFRDNEGHMGTQSINGLQEIGEAAIGRLESVNSARERALAETRQVVRLCANSIRAIHRSEFDTARDLLKQAQAILSDLISELESQQKIYWSGYVQDSQKEFAEACITLAIIEGTDLPDPQALRVDDAVYLNGLAEAAGELRRHVLDTIRRGELDRAETVLSVMDDIYGLLVTVDYPDAVTSGLRRSTDMVRGVLERTRGDLTMSRQQRELTDALQRAESILGDSQ